MGRFRLPSLMGPMLATVIICYGLGYRVFSAAEDAAADVAQAAHSLSFDAPTGAGGPTPSEWFESAARVPVKRHFRRCNGHNRDNCVVDGDTIRLNGERIRLQDIDTPETHRARCSSEQARGDRATERLTELMNSGDVAVEAGSGRDRYGRQLRTVTRDGRSVGDTLVSEGLARRWDGARHPWCN